LEGQKQVIPISGNPVASEGFIWTPVEAIIIGFDVVVKSI